MQIRDYIELTKPRITALIAATTAVGFFFGWNRNIPSSRYELLLAVHTLVGTALMASGTAALNQWWERDADARMKRTAGRPIPSRRIRASRALIFGVLISAIGFGELFFLVNILSACLGLFTLLTYLFVYTPMKRRSWLSTAVGAVPGAMPPLIGFAGASGALPMEAWALAVILFLWQFPHFYAIAWMYQDDYANAGMPMLPVVEPDGRSTAKQMVIFTAALIAGSILPWLLNMSGWLYGAGALALGLWFLQRTGLLVVDRTRVRARSVLLASVAYLPLLYGLMVLDNIH